MLPYSEQILTDSKDTNQPILYYLTQFKDQSHSSVCEDRIFGFDS